MNDSNPYPLNPAPVPTQRPVFAVPDEDEINFREVFDMIWSGKWIVLSITLSCVLLALAYALVAMPIYQATGLVQVEKDKAALGASLDQLSSLIGAAPTDAPAEIAIIKSRMVLSTVVDNLKLYIRAEPKYFPIIGRAIARRRTHLTSPASAPLGLVRYAWGGEKIKITALELPQSWYNLAFTLEAKGESFDIRNEAGQPILSGKVGERLTVTTPDGPLAIFVQELVARPGTTFIISRLAQQTVLGDLFDRLSVTEQPRDSGVLNLQVETDSAYFSAQLVNEIEDAYLRQNVERRSAEAEQSLDFLKKQLPELKGKVDEAQARLNSYQLRKGTVDVQQETELVLKQLVDLETQRLQLIQDRDAALQRYTSQHPVVATLNEQIRGLERAQANFKKQVESLPETQQEILSLMRDLEVNTQLYTALLNSAQELQVTKAGTVGNVRIIDYGLAPLKPVKPKKRMVLLTGLILGAFLGTLTVFAMRALLRGVDRPEDVERIIGLPTYASIPYSRAQQSIVGKVRRGRNSENMVLASIDPTDLAIEALRSLRTSLHFAMMESSNNVVMFTGPVAALGKSFVTINLGAVLAMSDKRVVVVDGDMRRGHLHRYIGAKQKPGLSDYIVGTVDDTSIICKTTIPGLDVIAGGTRPPNPSEILMSERFGSLLKMLSKSYDYVLIDTPPALPVTDAAIIGRLAGTTLIVLKSAEHPMRAIEETVKRLRQAGVQVRGMIFNQVGARVGSYGYGAYGYTYGYSAYGYKSTSRTN